MPNEKKAEIVLPGLIGAGIGAMSSPAGSRGEGAVHGAGRGIGLGVGAGAGGLAGALAGGGIGAGISQLVPDEYRGVAMGLPTLAGLVGGAGFGGYGGYHAGAGIAKGITGKKAPWQQKAPAPQKKKAPKREDDSEGESSKAAHEKLAAIVNNTSLSLNEKAERIQALSKEAIWPFSSGQPEPVFDGRPMHVREARPSGNPVAPELQQREKDTTLAGRLGISGNLTNAAGGALAGGAAGALLSRKNRFRNALLGAAAGGAGTYIGSHLANGGNLNSMLAGIGLGGLMGGKTASEKQAMPSLQDLGSYAKNLTSNIPAGVLQGAGMGGLGGGLAGGLAGLVAPGEEDVYDDEGNLVGRKQRSRFGAALRGLIGGGVMGAGAGGLAGHFAPDAVNSAYGAATGFGSDLAKRLGFGPKAPTSTANPKSPQEVALATEQGRGGNYAKSYRGSDKDYFSPSLQKGEAKRFRDAQTASAPGTMGASIASGNTGGQVSNPLYKGPNMANMQAPKSPTYTPTDTAGVAALRARAAANEQAKFDRQNESLMGPSAYAKSKAQAAAKAQQASMDQQAGIENVSPEVLAMKQKNPAEFARMLQQVRDKQVEENIRTAPSRGFDASGIDMSNMQLPGSPTLGR
jgi:hypothetical protein